jgi:hypothetical protein
MDVEPTSLFQRIRRYLRRQRKITLDADRGETEEGTRCLKERKGEKEERKKDRRWNRKVT